MVSTNTAYLNIPKWTNQSQAKCTASNDCHVTAALLFVPTKKGVGTQCAIQSSLSIVV